MMSIQPTEADRKAARRLIRTSYALRSLIDFLFATFILEVLANIVANKLDSVLPPFLTVYINLLGTWIKDNLGMTLLLLIIVGLVRIICFLQIKYAGTGLPPTDRQIEDSYLKFIKEQRKTLAPEGLPPRLGELSTRLDAIFTAPEFYPNIPYMPLTDHPLSKEEISAANVSQDDQSMWRSSFDESHKIDFPILWKNLTKEKPAAIIQGYPGIGKSTLLNALALYMAERRLNRWRREFERTLSMIKMPDAFVSKFRIRRSQASGFTALEAIESPLVPILINLHAYAKEKPTLTADKPLSNPMADYLQKSVSSQCPHWASFLQKCLQTGSCLIMFDGLDEVSKDRIAVQYDIARFIKHCCAQTNHAINFNRFLITSHVADYNQDAFPNQNYSHYIIADLKPEQIQDLINKYYDIYIREQDSFLPLQKPQELADEIKKRADLLSSAIKQDQHIGDLAKRPLLLYLLILILMNQKKVILPRQRIQLYTITIKLLLEKHSAEDSSRIDEEKAVQCLGLLAEKMIDNSKSFMHGEDVINSLKEAQSMTTEEAEVFLKRIRVRTGLFVERIKNGYSFYHQTFRDYFAARYILYQIEVRPERLKIFVEKALDKEVWQNLFLQAIAYEIHYKCDRKGLINKIVHDLINAVPRVNNKNRIPFLLFIAKCVLEAKGAIIESQLKGTLIETLIQSCIDALRNKQFEECDKIRDTIIHWIAHAIEENSLLPTRIAFRKDSLPLTEGTFSKYASLPLLALTAEQPSDTIYDIFEQVLQPAGSTTNIPPLEDAIEKFAHNTGEWLVSSDRPDEVRDMMLKMLRRSVPHSVGEIKFLRHLAENTPDQAIQDACVCALQKCIVNTPNIVDAMQYVTKSSLTSLSSAANTWLSTQKQNQTS